MTLGHDLMLLATLAELLVLLGTLVVVAKAVIAYRQHASRPLLLVGLGLFLLLVAPPAFEIAAEALLDGTAITEPIGRNPPTLTTIGTLTLIEELLRLAGVIALLASLYVRE